MPKIVYIHILYFYSNKKLIIKTIYGWHVVTVVVWKKVLKRSWFGANTMPPKLTSWNYDKHCICCSLERIINKKLCDDKTSSDKLSNDKMSNDKMSNDKMSTDKMSAD
jgi:hypothetical protein